MSRLSDQQVDAIAQQVLQRMSAGKGSAAPAGHVEAGDSGEKRLVAFRDMDAAVKAAQDAVVALDKLPLLKRDEIIASIRKASVRESESLAFAAHRETAGTTTKDVVSRSHHDVAQSRGRCGAGCLKQLPPAIRINTIPLKSQADERDPGAHVEAIGDSQATVDGHRVGANPQRHRLDVEGG